MNYPLKPTSMLKILILKGLPGSGKSTYAKQLIDKEPGKWKRINKDDMRAMFDNGKWSKENEKFVLSARNGMILSALHFGYNVIVDDTNLDPKHEEVITKAAKVFEKEENKDIAIEIKFFDISVEKCIENDLGRPKSVGEKVIRDMYNRYLKPKSKVIQYNPENPDVIICDIDGTLAIMKDRGPYEWEKVGQDLPNKPVIDLLQRLIGQNIIIFSGRDACCREKTEKWLADNDIFYDELWMRSAGDMRKDSIIKKELFDKHIRGKYNVKFVLDDRNQVVEMWRSLGLTCLQVADGNF